MPAAREANETRVLQRDPLVPLSDVEGRIRSILPAGFCLTPLTKDRLLDLEDEESGHAQLYFRSRRATHCGPFPETIDACAAQRERELADGYDLLASAPLRHLLVGGRPAVQSAARFWWRDAGESFEWWATYIRRDEVVASARRPELVRPALETFLQALVYR